MTFQKEAIMKSPLRYVPRSGPATAMKFDREDIRDIIKWLEETPGLRFEKRIYGATELLPVSRVTTDSFTDESVATIKLHYGREAKILFEGDYVVVVDGEVKTISEATFRDRYVKVAAYETFDWDQYPDFENEN